MRIWRCTMWGLLRVFKRGQTNFGMARRKDERIYHCLLTWAHALLAASEKVPLTHAMHSDAPVFEYVPPTHEVQL